MKEKLRRLTDQYLREKEHQQIHHINIAVPGHDGRFWIIDPALFLGKNHSAGPGLAIYFSVNPHSKKGRRVVQVIDLLDPFEKYEQAIDGRYTVYYLLSGGNNSKAISEEATAKIQALFPALDLAEVELSLEKTTDWTGGDA